MHLGLYGDDLWAEASDTLKSYYTVWGVFCVTEHAGAGGRKIQIRRVLWAEPENGKLAAVFFLRKSRRSM